MGHRMTAFAAAALLIGALQPAAGRAAEREMGWKGRAEVSYARTSGNTDTQTLGAKLKTSYDATPNRYFGKASVLFADENGQRTSSQWFAEGRYERDLTERLFAFFTASYLKDTFAGYDSRINAGPGLGYQIVRTDRHELKGFLSVLYSRDNRTDGTDDTYASGKAAAEYAWQITDGLTFTQSADYQVDLGDSSVYFVNSETGLQVAVNSRVSLGLTYQVAYQGDPPPDTDRTDTTFLTSLVVDF